jgi:hypothetical protein
LFAAFPVSSVAAFRFRLHSLRAFARSWTPFILRQVWHCLLQNRCSPWHLRFIGTESILRCQHISAARQPPFAAITEARWTNPTAKRHPDVFDPLSEP